MTPTGETSTDTGEQADGDATLAERPLRADARRNRERILSAGAEVFAECGANAQMDDVARCAGVGVGTVYRHFPTKEALMGALVRRKFDLIEQAAAAALDVDDPWESFAAVIEAGAQIMAADAALRDALSRVPEAWDHAAVERERVLAIMDRIIRRGQEAGVIRKDFSAAEMPMIMCGLTSVMSQRDAEWDWRRHLAIVLDGIRAR
jgi:AcrR family transcriptional regulator